MKVTVRIHTSFHSFWHHDDSKYVFLSVITPLFISAQDGMTEHDNANVQPQDDM